MISAQLINVRKSRLVQQQKFHFRKNDYQRLTEKLEVGIKNSLKQIKDEKVETKLVQNIGYELEQLRNRQKPEQLFKYLSIAYESG